MRVFTSSILCILFAVQLSAQQKTIDLRDRIKTASSDKELLTAYRDVIDSFLPIQVDSAIHYAEKGLEVFSAKHYKVGEAWMLNNLGEIDDEHGRNEIAKQRLTFALTLFKEAGDKKGLTESEMSLGILNARIGNYNDATIYFTDALKTFDSINSKGGMMRALTNLGIINERNNNPGLSLEYFTKAEEISKTLPLSDETINLYNNIAGYYIDRKDTAKAMQYLELAIKKSDTPEFIGSHLSCLINLGILAHQAGNTQKSMDYLFQALKIAEEKNLPEEEANIYANLALTTAAKNKPQALKYANEALNLCKKIDDKPLLADVYEQIADVYKSLNDYKSAYEAREIRQNIMDSIYNKNRVQEIENLTAIYQLKKSNDKVRKMEQLTKEIFRQRNLIISVALIIIIALIIVLIYYRKMSSLNKRLIIHEKELRESSAMKDKLFSIIGHDLRAPIARIPSIIEIFEYEDTSEEDKKYLMQNLLEHSKVLLETLDKLLYWGQLLIKGILIRQEVFNPNQFINENIQLKKKHAEEKHIPLINKVNEKITVYSDPQHFDFIIRNLLVNAIKFSFENGMVEINADEKTKPGFVIFSVKDKGVGIDRAQFSKIFEPHYSMYGTANEKGNGIGLMLCKEFIVKNGGEIWLESEIGKGTTFYFTVKQPS